MRHQYRKPHLNRSSSHRKALFSNLSAELFTHKRIVTTLGKAKYARRFAERLITFARRGDVAARRHVYRFIHSRSVIKVLFDELGPHFKNRNGGYTRIIKLGPRHGDAAPMALLELVGFDDIETIEHKGEGKSRLKVAQKKAIKEKAEETDIESEEPKHDETEEEKTVRSEDSVENKNAESDSADKDNTSKDSS